MSPTPVEPDTDLQTSVDFVGLADLGAQWWAEAGAERAFAFRVFNAGRAAQHVPLTVVLGPNLRLTAVECWRGQVSCLDASAGAQAPAVDSIGMNEGVRVIVRAVEQIPQSYVAQVVLSTELMRDATAWNNADVHQRHVWQADRSVAVDAPAAATAGGELEVRVAIANRGPDSFYEPRRLALPAGVSAQELACAMSDGTPCTTATLDRSDVGVYAGQTAVLQFRLRVPADFRGPLTFGKTVASTGDPNPADNAVSTTIQVGPPGTP